ncbi:MAG: hypothetical protein CL734_04835 [Chloroflexi bacterium]|nr:hypothetical protein [Chloroflexota bacterium]
MYNLINQYSLIFATAFLLIVFSLIGLRFFSSKYILVFVLASLIVMILFQSIQKNSNENMSTVQSFENIRSSGSPYLLYMYSDY